VEIVCPWSRLTSLPLVTVAGFIGVSNLMPAAISRPGEVRLDHGPTLQVPTHELAPGEYCSAVVRPEKLRIEPLGAGAAPESNGLPRVQGVVESSIYLGTSTQIVVDLGDGVRMTVLVPNANEAERQRLPGGGARVALSWEPEHMHLVRESPRANRGIGDRGDARGAAREELEAVKRG